MTRRLTPGEAALREAARLEAARIYGRVCPEHKQPISVAAAVAEAEVSAKPAQHYDMELLKLIRAGKPNSELVELYGYEYATIRAARMHLMRNGVA